MPAPIAILQKIKYLQSLANSDNVNEADNARALAEKLIAKHNVSEEELSSLDPKEYYGENEKLFSTIGVVSWRQQLALTVGNYFEAQIIQEEVVPVEGAHEFNYYVYGEPDQVKDIKFVYGAFIKKIESLLLILALGRGPIYIDSYCEGIVESIKYNIQMYGINVPEIKKPIEKKEEQQAPVNKEAISKTKSEKEEPTDKRVNVKNGSLIKDIHAYFRGLNDGKELSLQDILELESESQQSSQITAGEEASKQ